MTNKNKIFTFQSPGRINLIGEHTDYNQGYVLPAAIDKNIQLRISKNNQLTNCKITANNLKESFEFDLQNYQALNGGWQNYVLGVVHELQKMGANILAFDAEFEGTIPLGAGMSSSAALECVFAFALNEMFDLGFDRWQLIKAAQKAEHHFVGTKCGIMDQFASMMGKQNQVILLDCRSLDYEYFPLDLGDFQLLLLNTNVSHALADSEYNARRSSCEEAVELIQNQFPKIKSLRDLSVKMLAEVENFLPDKIFRRCKHVVNENERVLLTTKALQNKNFKRVGELIYQSHFSLQKDYEVSCPELDFLVRETIALPYVLGARMMGGGFGGSTINMLEKAKCANFVEQISKKYKKQFGIELTAYFVRLENGTGAVNYSQQSGKTLK